MKTRLLSLVIVILLLATSLAFADSLGATRDQAIGAKVTDDQTLQVTSENANPVEAVATDNQIIILKNPTFQELKDFILKDPTSRNTFVPNKYECRNFAIDVKNNADTAGLRCAFVLLCYNNGQHSVVAFNTTDRGMVYIEPQTDAAISPVIGGTYQGEQIIDILICW